MHYLSCITAFLLQAGSLTLFPPPLLLPLLHCSVTPFLGLTPVFPPLLFLTNQFIEVENSYHCHGGSLVRPHGTQPFRESLQLKLKSETLSEPFPAVIQAFKMFFFFSDQAKHRLHMR